MGDLTDIELIHLCTPLDAHRYITSSRIPRPRGGIATFLFQQPSLRTHSSFAAAAAALGLTPVTITTTGGELRDQCDLIDELVQLSYTSRVVISRTAFCLSDERLTRLRCPLLNAGDASNEHPSQALLDLTTLRTLGLRADSHVVLLGNLAGHRVNHSLLLGLLRLGIPVTLLSPVGLEMPVQYLQGTSGSARVRAFALASPDAADSILSTADFIYQSPLPAWTDPRRGPLAAHALTLERARRVLKPQARILHPFPRHGELGADLDGSAYDGYTLQTSLGPAVRARLLQFVLKH